MTCFGRLLAVSTIAVYLLMPTGLCVAESGETTARYE